MEKLYIRKSRSLGVGLSLLGSFLVMLFCSVLFSFEAKASEDQEALKRLPVQDVQEGRFKPFDTFSREALQLIYGRESYQKKQAVDIVMTWLLVPDLWDSQKIIQVRHSGLREALQLTEKTEIYHSPKELFSNDRVGLLFQELRGRVESGEKLNPYYQAIQTLQGQWNTFQGIRSGRLLAVAPQKDSDSWKSIAELDGKQAIQFQEISKAFSSYLKQDSSASTKGELKQAIDVFVSDMGTQFPEKYPDLNRIGMEVTYNSVEPFMWSWIAYLIGVFFLGSAMVSRKDIFYQMGWTFAIAGFLIQAVGVGMRVYVMERPPVTTMFETVIWVPWIAVLCAFVLEYLQRSRIVLLGASLVSVLCLIVSDLAPVVLNDTMSPLEPVLRDNFWLLTHVVIIVSSYGAFFLAFMIGDLVLFYFLRGEEKHKTAIKEGVKAIYRSIQVGVVLLTAGTILGGVWADYSWGRFWGWDPKETWAFIALMGYLAVLHGRLAGWLKDFGMAVGAVVSFSLVIMAWYGVNFVLGAGLHTYGFGAGGVEYVSAFVGLHLLFASYIITVRYLREKQIQKPL